MYYQDHLQFLENILNKCHLQTLRLLPHQPLPKESDKGLRRILGAFDEGETFSDFFPGLQPQTLYRVADIFFCRYIFFALPEGCIYAIGPYLNEELTHQRILEHSEQLGLSPRQAKELEYYYMELPIIREESPILAMADSFAAYLWGGEDRYEWKELFRENTAAFLPDLLPRNEVAETNEPGIAVIEARYSYENDLIEAISKGDLRKAEQMVRRFSSLTFEARVTDPLRNIKNYCIIMNTLYRKAAERGGVHPYLLDTTSSGIAKNIENLRSVEESMKFMEKILRTYCRLVQEHSMNTYSALIRSVLLTVRRDLTADLSLAAMAREQNVSPAYLSARFKKEVGQTLTAYINEQRIEQAKHLLRNTTLQIQTVALHCGILDLHYFCRLFKSSTGKTPSEYRSALSGLQ